MKTATLSAILILLSLAACAVDMSGVGEEQPPSQTGESNAAASAPADQIQTDLTLEALDHVSVTEAPEPAQPEPTDTPEPSQANSPVTPEQTLPAPTESSTSPTKVPDQTTAALVVDQVVWVLIPSGNVIVGSTDEQAASAYSACVSSGRDCFEMQFEREIPRESVFVEQFAITKFEITNAQYDACVLAGVCRPTRTDLDESPISYQAEFADPDRPVVGVSATDASTFCREWLDARLPGRAEWERAARGDDTRTFPWGDTPDPARANLSGAGTFSGESHPDGASPFGVFHMTGNVWEWTDQDVRLAGNMPPKIVVRGGGWNSLPFEGRISYLGESLDPFLARYDIGIRCVRDQGNPSIVQQTEPITIRFDLEGDMLHWLVRNAASATITCYPVLGRTISGHWALEIGVEGSAPIPDRSVTCNLSATGYDGSSDSATLAVGRPSPGCAIAPAPVFADIHQQHAADLGCAVEEMVTIPTIAEQGFQGGHMLWRSDTDAVYVIYSPAGQWQSDPSWKWDGSHPDGAGLVPPPGFFEPKQGFGWLWRNHLGGEHSGLGWATEPERGYENTGQIQVFEEGLLIKGNDAKIFVLLNKDRR
ncbi:MAG: SUMF1/EgtB/PvdO family nonheme iron enzyme [Chloroflexota bacterium]|nr:SUMF1/EgtB/PvdO family nonheme iron enzyme [Chloroflexota bacterium]